MDIIQSLVKNVVETSYADLPGTAVDLAKLSILDTLGCIIAGADAPGCNEVKEQVLDWGGKRESSIMLHGGKVPCPNAALVNSVMARALDFDTVWERGLHMSAASVPTAFAVAELCKDVTGKKLLTALIAGEDIAARVHMSTLNYDGFEPTGVCGIFGIAAITGKLLNLDERQMLDALGIAFNRSAGSYQPNIDGALAVRVMEGLASKSGVEAALLAQRGISGGEGVLEGTYGYFHLFSRGRYNREILVENLGREFPGIREATYKKYPACGGTTTAIEATLDLLHENDIEPEEVDEITVDSSPFFFNQLGKPFRIGSNPQVDAQFSYRYTVANALVRKRFTVDDITPDAISDPRVLEIVAKVHPRANENLERDSSRATIVSIRTKDGGRYAKQVNYPRGSKQNPISREEIKQKFQSCAQRARESVSEAKAGEIMKVIDQLENVSDITEVLRLL